MRCPLCSKEMESSKRTTYGKELREYSSKTYLCKEDDVWITVEIPKDKLRALS